MAPERLLLAGHVRIDRGNADTPSSYCSIELTACRITRDFSPCHRGYHDTIRLDLTNEIDLMNISKRDDDARVEDDGID